MLAMEVNDNAGSLMPSGARAFIASMLAPAVVICQTLPCRIRQSFSRMCLPLRLAQT